MQPQNTSPKPKFSPLKNKLINTNSKFSKRNLLVFALVFGVIGSYFVYKNYAASSVVAKVEAEQMVLPASATILTDSSASAGSAVQFKQDGATATSQVSLPSESTSVSLSVRSSKCRGGWASVQLSVDNKVVIPRSNASSTRWMTLNSPALSLASGAHTVSITYYASKCSNLFADVISFNGTLPSTTPAPTVALNASPTSVTSGGSSTLTWSSTNATSCTASGSWSGTKPTSGSTDTGALNASAPFGLSCTGSGGTAQNSVIVTTTTALPPPPPTAGIDISTYGAVGDGVTDDTAALNKAFSTAPSGSVLLIPAGKTYKHTGSVKITVAGLHLTGSGTLLATNQLDSSLQIRAANVTIDGGMLLKFNTAGATRQAAGWQTMIFIDHVSGATVRNITIDGSPSAGMMMYGASNYMIDTVTVQNTLADAIHSTLGSHDGIIKNPTIRNPGDDGVAVVSYLPDGVMCYNIQVISPRLYGQKWGRGFTVVGGHDVTYTDVYAEGSAGAAIYVAAEGASSWNTYGSYNVKYLGGTLVNSNTVSSIDHGAINIFNDQPTQKIATVDIENMVIQNTRTSASRNVAVLGTGGGGISGVQLRNFTITGGPSTVFTAQTGSSDYNTINWIFNGTHLADHTGFTPYP